LTEGKFVGVIGSKKVRNIAITIHRLTLPRTQLAWTEFVHGGSLAGLFIDLMPGYFKKIKLIQIFVEIKPHNGKKIKYLNY
jgi:hypothetical protein